MRALSAHRRVPPGRRARPCGTGLASWIPPGAPVRPFPVHARRRSRGRRALSSSLRLAGAALRHRNRDPAHHRDAIAPPPTTRRSGCRCFRCVIRLWSKVITARGSQRTPRSRPAARGWRSTRRVCRRRVAGVPHRAAGEGPQAAAEHSNSSSGQPDGTPTRRAADAGVAGAPAPARALAERSSSAARFPAADERDLLGAPPTPPSDLGWRLA